MSGSDKQGEALTRKQKIVERYKGVDPSKLEVIPAETSDAVNIMEQQLKVAAYIRVSTENDEQKSSFELQQNDFTNRINANPRWEFAGLYSDEGLSGTELSHRKGMLQMIEDAKAGKINLILAKSIARFARNVVDCLSIIEELRSLNPPVGVYFDESNLYTLDSTGALVLTILATVAEEESRSKSFIMNWSVEKRFSNGIFLTPELLGYDKDEDGNLIVNPTEAETVKVIYDLYLNGWSTVEIADLLTQYGRKTKMGNTVWNSGTISGVLANERHCGDVLARKTFTPNFKTHKSKKNRKDRNQYLQRGHHEAIVSRKVFDAAHMLQESMRFAKGNRALPVLSVVEDGVLKGFVPIHKDWTGFPGEAIRAACESVGEDVLPEIRPLERQINFTGYQEVRGTFFSTVDKPAMTLSAGRMRFNTVCLRRFKDVEYVELLLNTVRRCIAIRPCSRDNPNAIRWGQLKQGRLAVRDMCCRGLSQILIDVMDWIAEDRYKFCGEFFKADEGGLIIFRLDEPVITKTETQVYIPAKADAATAPPGCASEEADAMKYMDGVSETEEGLAELPVDAPEEAGTEMIEEVVLTKKVRIYAPEWGPAFGLPVTSVACVSLLERQHYAGEWDILRPAREVEALSILTTEQLEELLQEAENIIEGWSENV